MSKYCDYKKDNFYSCLSKDKDLLDQLYEVMCPNSKHERLRKEELELNKIELIKIIKFYKGHNQQPTFCTNMKLSETDVKEISDKYGLYYNLDFTDGYYHFMFKDYTLKEKEEK